MLICQEPPLFDDGSIVNLSGFNCYHWLCREDLKDKNNKVTDVVKVKGERHKRKGKNTNLKTRKRNAKENKNVSKQHTKKNKKAVIVIEKEKEEIVLKNKFDGKHIRACVYVRNNLIACIRSEGCTRDSVAVEICHNTSAKSVVVSSLYMENGRYPVKLMEKLKNTP